MTDVDSQLAKIILKGGLYKPKFVALQRNYNVKTGFKMSYKPLSKHNSIHSTEYYSFIRNSLWSTTGTTLQDDRSGSFGMRTTYYQNDKCKKHQTCLK